MYFLVMWRDFNKYEYIILFVSMYLAACIDLVSKSRNVCYICMLPLQKLYNDVPYVYPSED